MKNSILYYSSSKIVPVKRITGKALCFGLFFMLISISSCLGGPMGLMDGAGCRKTLAEAVENNNYQDYFAAEADAEKPAEPLLAFLWRNYTDGFYVIHRM